MRWNSLRNALDRDVEAETFEVTHHFHPLRGQQFRLVKYRHNWGEDRAYYHDDGQLTSIPAAWTSLSARDPFLELSAGRSEFRPVDLVELAALVSRVLKEHGRRRGTKQKRGVK